jgi:DNA repair protein RecN (Recombination protein N)
LLTHIHLKNFTIIKSLSINLKEGLSVLTGETGAGKSILIDAVSIGLGARFDARFMRHNASTCEITLCFDLERLTEAKDYLKAQEFDLGNECIIRRVLTQDGRSKCSLNDTPCTVQFIRGLGQYLVCFYGQHAHQALLQSQAQRFCLDAFANQLVLSKKIQALYDYYVTLDRQLSTLQEKNKTSALQKDYLRYQLEELQFLDLKAGAWEMLSQQHQEQLNSVNNRGKLNQLQLLLCNGEPNPASLLSQAVVMVDQMKEPIFNNVKNLLRTAEIHLQEATAELQQYELDHEVDPGILEQLDQKLSIIYNLARKHRVPPEQLWEVVVRLQQQMDELNALDDQIIILTNRQKGVMAQYASLARKLTKQRRLAAEQLSLRVTEQLQQLGMRGAIFNVELIEREEEIHSSGREKIVFMVSTNPGQPLTLMQKVISGGELSRLGLALQVIAQHNKSIRTLIFDEVDTGIGGRTARIVGELLRQLALNSQVFCITHLPQIAARADNHVSVVKHIESGETFAVIHSLNRDERIKELARMSTGGKMTDALLKHAEALLAETE